MRGPVKDWLVRTRAGDVLGPFTQRELMEELKRNLFSVEDEIAPSQGHWISAQALSYHDSEESTSTSARTNHGLTSSITADVQTADSDLTPTPEARISVTPNKAIAAPVRIPPHLVPKAKESRTSPVVLSVLVLGGLISGIAFLKFRRSGSPTEAVSLSSATAGQNEGESPFVRQVYSLIHAGKTQAALRALTLYHERGPAKEDVEYLVPYAALLILEGESSGRARKFLDIVIDSDTSAYLKSRAHLWLGYLGLMTDRMDLAESGFLEALQLAPKDPTARFNLGRTYLKQEKYPLAMDYLQLAELEAPDLWLIQIYKGRAKFALEQTTEAQSAFRAALDLAPDRWIAYIYYALFLSQTGRNEEAHQVLSRMLTRDPHYEVHSPAPFGFFQEKVNYTEYLNAFIHVMEKFPGEDRDVGRRYIQYLLSNNDEGGKLEAMGVKGGLLSKIVGLKVTLDRESSAGDLKKAIQRLPDGLDSFGYYAYVLRGEAFGRLGLFDDAKKEFRKALELSPQSAITRWAYAALLQKLQDTAEAQTQVRELIRYHPHYIPAIVWSQNL
jgi:tetratricopeptide (TPR) repeat protein